MARRRTQRRQAKQAPRKAANRAVTRASRGAPKPTRKGTSTKARTKTPASRPARRRRAPGLDAGMPADFPVRPLRSARLAGGDVDADLERVASSGEEAVGGSEPTPDQDVVDEIGDALGVGRKPDAQVIMSSEMLAGRDRRRPERRPPPREPR